MPKRAADEPGTSASTGEDPSVFNDSNEQQQTSAGEPSAKRMDLEIKQEPIDYSEQSGAITLDERLVPANIKLEADAPEEEEENDEDSRSPIAALEDEEEDEDDADSLIDKTNIPPPSDSFVDCAGEAIVPADIAIASWELYYHAAERVSLEGSEKAWQLSAIYYYLLTKGIKRRGKTGRLLTQPFPVSILTVANSFDISVAELIDKTVRFGEIIHSRKMRRFLEYFRRVQEGLAVSCVIFKKFCKIYRELFGQVKEGSDSCPSSYDLFTILWTSFLVMKSRLPTDDLVNNYQLLFSMLDHLYTDMCSMKDGIVHHLNQDFVQSLISTDTTIVRALCGKFGGCVLDTRHFQDHIYKKMEKTGIPSTWDFVEFSDLIINTPKTTYDQYLLQRGGIDERIFIPQPENFPDIFKDSFQTSKVLKTSHSGQVFRDAEFLNTISSNQCLEKLSNGKCGQERIAQAREQPKVPCVEYNLELGNYPEDNEFFETRRRLRKLIDGWSYESSKLKTECERMSDSPAATILLKCDQLASKFEQTLSEESAEKKPDSPLSKYHSELRKELETVFYVFMEKIIVSEMKKKVREEDLLNVIRREEFLDSVFCFCVELTMFSNNYDRAFPWSAELCECHPFMFHKVIDLMITHEKRLSRQMVRHFSRIEEKVVECFAWKCDSPLWPMVARCPFTHFQEFGEDWSDKLNSYSPIKFTPIKKPEDLRDELGRPIIPQNQTSRTLRIFLKRVYFTAASRLQELTDRIGMGSRGKSQCWSLFDYLLRSDTLIFMDRHIDHILLCCVFVIMKINESPVTFQEILGQYRRQNSDASSVYRNVSVFYDQLDEENGEPINIKETITERLEAPTRIKTEVDVIKYYNLEFRERIKFIIGQIDNAPDDDLMEMPVATTYGLAPVRVYLAQNLSIQMLPKTKNGESKQERAISNLEKNGCSLDFALSRVKE
ncbi:unnamed protein product [Caenorhabditis brenneri]